MTQETNKDAFQGRRAPSYQMEASRAAQNGRKPRSGNEDSSSAMFGGHRRCEKQRVYGAVSRKRSRGQSHWSTMLGGLQMKSRGGVYTVFGNETSPRLLKGLMICSARNAILEVHNRLAQGFYRCFRDPIQVHTEHLTVSLKKLG